MVKKFVLQFGIHGTPEIARKWGAKHIKDDPVVLSNSRGTLTFAAVRQSPSRRCPP